MKTRYMPLFVTLALSTQLIIADINSTNDIPLNNLNSDTNIAESLTTAPSETSEPASTSPCTASKTEDANTKTALNLDANTQLTQEPTIDTPLERAIIDSTDSTEDPEN